MKQLIVMMVLVIGFGVTTSAQIDLNKIFDLGDIAGKVLKVEKGFSPRFYLGNVQIPKVNKLGEILGMKQNDQINKLFRTFKTGRTIYKVAAYAGSAIALYGTIKSIDKAALKKDYQGAIIGGLTTIGTGVLTKLLTKAASYKAVDIFNGVVRKKIGDIFSIQPASSTYGIGIYVKL